GLLSTAVSARGGASTAPGPTGFVATLAGGGGCRCASAVAAGCPAAPTAGACGACAATEGAGACGAWGLGMAGELTTCDRSPCFESAKSARPPATTTNKPSTHIGHLRGASAYRLDMGAGSGISIGGGPYPDAGAASDCDAPPSCP